MATPPVLLDIQGLDVRFQAEQGELHAVRQLDLQVGGGETVALVGESGCGKSTTALAVLRLLARNAQVDVAVIGLIGVEAPSRLKTIMRLGATATLRKPVYGGSVYSALFVGVNAFRQRRALTTEIAEHERRRHGRRYLIKAILKVMEAAGCDEDAAYDRLRRESMRQRLSIEEYCERFVRALPGAHEPSIRLQGATNAEKSTQGGK